MAGSGVESCLSAPLSIDDRHLGALDIYGLGDHHFDDVDERVVGVFVTAVEAATWNSRRAELLEPNVDGLQEAKKTSAYIEQAKGIIMGAREESQRKMRLLSSRINRRTQTSTLPMPRCD
ncbi:GAF domain-containing protein [Rhodococcoides fascians]|uniref:GAF domain-containing protein n=1 Tax=Rhodococcoides fascians TaxID=1828 RepID=UPI00068D1CED|nr:GAF domain-containing protein [Rhodococcus fascians]